MGFSKDAPVTHPEKKKKTLKPKVASIISNHRSSTTMDVWNLTQGWKEGAGRGRKHPISCSGSQTKKHDAALTQQDLNNQPIFMARSMIGVGFHSSLPTQVTSDDLRTKWPLFGIAQQLQRQIRTQCSHPQCGYSWIG